MKRAGIWTMAAVLMVSMVAYAADGEPPASMEMDMMQCPMMGAMGAADLAAWGGNLYLLKGMNLTRLDRNGNAVKSVELPDMSEKMKAMQEKGMCPMMDMMGGKGPGMGRGNGPGMKGDTMKRMHRMHTMKMMSAASVTADGNGVYVLRAGEMTIYDHNLNQVSRVEVLPVADDTAGCPMCAKMGAGMPSGATPVGPGMATCNEPSGPGPSYGGLERPRLEGFSEPAARAMADGEVTMQYRHVAATGAIATVYLGVLDVNGKPDAKASVRAYVYPNDNPAGGMNVDLVPASPGYFIGKARLAGAGPWELAVRVGRADIGGAVVYYSMASCP